MVDNLKPDITNQDRTRLEGEAKLVSKCVLGSILKPADYVIIIIHEQKRIAGCSSKTRLPLVSAFELINRIKIIPAPPVPYAEAEIRLG